MLFSGGENSPARLCVVIAKDFWLVTFLNMETSWRIFLPKSSVILASLLRDGIYRAPFNIPPAVLFGFRASYRKLLILLAICSIPVKAKSNGKRNDV